MTQFEKSQWAQRDFSQNYRDASPGIPEEYKANQDNTPDTLESQLRALEAIGFEDVDCYFKYGLFSWLGGRK
ncbi:MAG: hypothetical protein GY809_33090 [Planctomycetes bacterium]|nr:hypothetical protein [Planctomycetota bacterium]